MKINEKHLVAFASGTSPTDKEGYMLKRGELNKAFQQRWFVLKGNLLFYFDKKTDREPIGVIILEGCTVELADNEDAYAFKIVFEGSSSRSYMMACNSQEEMESWMKAVTCAGYEYMKLMVAELQRHLDDVNRTESAVIDTPESHLLVDFSTDDTNVCQKSQSHRYNPFDFNSTDVLVFNDGVEHNPLAELVEVQKARTFDEMHIEFGKYIKEKMQQQIVSLMHS